MDGGSSAYYSDTVDGFLASAAENVLGVLAAKHTFALDVAQRDAWQRQLQVLHAALNEINGTVYLEFDIPRLGSRIDAVLVSGSAIFPIEFKCGERQYELADRNQAWDYALDLKNFHRASHDAPIFPILCATDAPSSDGDWKPPHPDDVREPRKCNAADLGRVIREGLALATGPELDGQAWGRAPYHPTPTIIEAARALYSRHSVEAISRSEAEGRNLAVTSVAVEEIIERAYAQREKAIIFVTGVPGAGKTLVGLNIATRHSKQGADRAVFLSGNGPLVDVLREALTRDELTRSPAGTRKGQIRGKVKAFIQNVHHFRDEGLRNPADPPFDHVVIFDEAQRAWHRQKTADFMKRRKGIPDFQFSEPTFLISYLHRHQDWAAVICLVGGGQEIHQGEAGIAEWFDAIRRFFPDWHVYVSPDLTDTEYAAGHALDAFTDSDHVVRDARLHLATSMRSFRSNKVSAFVKAVLDCEIKTARDLLQDVLRRYPIVATRDLAQAKQWIRERARGNERYGLVASSQAQRLKPHAIDVRVNVDPIHYFLNDRNDTRSSWYLEDAATEFQIQGLELDWICMTWDADLRLQKGQWSFHSFRGKRWEYVGKGDRKRYLLNAYRVLLTRARQGMVIFVPPGDANDPTRNPSFYDETFGYLTDVGVPALDRI
jgi:hypothetical protein